MDFKLLCAAKEITDVVENQDLFTEATGLYPTMHRGNAMPNHYYAKRSDGMQFALLYMSECTHKLLSMLTLDERKVFVENIRVDFDNGEKPVAFGGSFLPRVDKQKQETHKSEPSNHTALTLDEQKVFVENISVDYDNGEKPVAFGRSFLPGADKQKQETHKSEPCNDTAPTLDERKVFVENISVDSDNGEKPVAFGGSFLPGADKQKQDTHKSEPCNDTTLTHTTQPKRSFSTPVLRYQKQVGPLQRKTRTEKKTSPRLRPYPYDFFHKKFTKRRPRQ